MASPQTSKKRAIQKSVLLPAHNSAHDWPKLSDEVHDEILTKLIELLSPIGDQRRALNDGRSQNKRRRTVPIAAEHVPHVKGIASPCILGFNAVMAAVEKGIVLPAIVITRPPSIITHHFPELCGRRGIRLVALKEGSEARLGQAVGLPRVSVIGVLESGPDLSILHQQIDLVKAPAAVMYRAVEVETTTEWIPIQSKETNRSDK